MLALIKESKRRSRLSVKAIAEQLELSEQEVELCLNGDGEELNAMADLCRGLGHSPSHFLHVMEGCSMSIDQAIAKNTAWEMNARGLAQGDVFDRIQINSPHANIGLILWIMKGNLPRLENIRRIALLVSNHNLGENFSYFISRAETDLMYPEPNSETKAA
jgi:hypothetical protein